MMRTSQRRASTAARRASGARTGATPRRTGSREVPVTERRTPGELAAAVIREGGVKLWSLVAGGLLLLAGLGFGGWRLLHGAGGGAGSGAGEGFDANHIAVLYFDQRGGSDSLGYLADGLTEALIHELGQVSQLQVISRNGVLPYKKTTVPPDSIGRALRVGTLVQGTVAQAGDRLRVNVSLINASTGAEIGSKVLERPRQEIFALQDDLAKEVSFFLRQQLGAEIEVAQSRAGTSDVAAWEALQKGLAETRDVERLVATGDTAAAGHHYEVADSLLRRAEQIDPKWQAPPTQRGWLAYRRGRLLNSVDKTSNAAWTGKALEHADRALQLKPNDPDALELKGTLAYWRWLLNLEPDPRSAAKLLEEAEQDFRAAVDVNPDQASAWNSLSHLLINKSQMAEAKLAALRAYESDPYLSNADLTLFRLFTTSVDLGDGLEAAKWCRVGHERFPSDPSFTECQIWLLFMEGQKPDIGRAWELLGQYVQLNPPDSREYERLRGQMIVAAVIARAAASGGQATLRDSARAVILKSRLDANRDPTRELALWEAIARTVLGDKDEAFGQLSVYLATNPQQRTAMAKEQTWYFKDLRSDARWTSLIGAVR